MQSIYEIQGFMLNSPSLPAVTQQPKKRFTALPVIKINTA